MMITNTNSSFPDQVVPDEKMLAMNMAASWQEL